MYYRYLGSSNSQILQYYHFTSLDNLLQHNFSEYYLNYNFVLNVEYISGQYSGRVNFSNFSGMEDTAGMNCIIYLYSDLDSTYYNITNLPNANIDNFNVQLWSSTGVYDMVVACGYTSEYYQNGYNSEYENGYSYGYELGYRDGYSVNSEESYQDGYDTGLRDGYDQGVNSDNDYTGVFGLLGQAFGSASDLMGVSIVGGLTIGTFTMIPIAITIVISIFRLMRK